VWGGDCCAVTDGLGGVLVGGGGGVVGSVYLFEFVSLLIQVDYVKRSTRDPMYLQHGVFDAVCLDESIAVEIRD
jgi:hypothetical protein